MAERLAPSDRIDQKKSYIGRGRCGKPPVLKPPEADCSPSRKRQENGKPPLSVITDSIISIDGEIRCGAARAATSKNAKAETFPTIPFLIHLAISPRSCEAIAAQARS
ncbi:hypothetical protein [Sphingobium sp.]|uniref:hypothetical protein n=1 Tax=Sphingobium TaxID=165695 RepID=UPI001A1BF0D5|nr:hypothetical protein [Sphingobium sp.]MBJ7375845.1 hypothetical protein [Sphingobium sp.]